MILAQLDQGGWSMYPLIVYPAIAVIISAATLFVVQRYSGHNLTPKEATVIPFVAGLVEALILMNSIQEPWFWLYVGTAVTIGASVAFGSAISHRERTYGLLSLVIMLGGIMMARLLSQTPLTGILVLVVSGSLVGFGIGYVLPSLGYEFPKRSTHGS